MQRTALILLMAFTFLIGKAQYIDHHMYNKTVYEFLDEMAAMGYIELNSAIKPYSRIFISDKLTECANFTEKLNQRQQKELAFFMRDFGKEKMSGYNRKTDKKNKRLDLLFYKDSLFSVTANPIGGIQIWKNENGSATHRWNGADVFSSAGNWGFYASLRDNNESEFLTKENYLNQRMGGNSKGTGDYSEMRGGVTYAWKWGMIGLVKDHFAWGNNYNGANIFSGRTPSFSHIKLKMKPVNWFEFNYVHGWLVSEVVDSTRSYYYTNAYGTNPREVFHSKYLATNMFTFTVFPRTKLSFGNSIIYSDINVHPSYLTPLFFFKSIDHTLNAADSQGQNVGQNSHMFFDFSTRYVKHLHVYGSLFVDEFSFERFKEYNGKVNFFSLKAGAQVHNFPIRNTFLTVEYTRTKPLAFQHYVTTTTFETNGYNLGHYLEDNSEELFIHAAIRPLPTLYLGLSFTNAKKGKDYTALGNEVNDGSRIGLPYMDTVEWESTIIKASLRWEVVNDFFLFGELIASNTTGDVDTYTAPLFHGKQQTISVGFNIGY